MKHLRKTKIVGTIGPASENKLEELFAAGLNVTRVNYSHGSWDEQSEKTENILKLREELDIPVALLFLIKWHLLNILLYDDFLSYFLCLIFLLR